MSDIIIALGDKDNVFEDISILAKKVSENPEVIISTGKEIKNHIIEKSSALFIEQNIVMAFVDPSDEIIHSLEHQLLVLKERLQIILYYTSATKDFKKPIEGKEITFSKDKIIVQNDGKIANIIKFGTGLSNLQKRLELQKVGSLRHQILDDKMVFIIELKG